MTQPPPASPLLDLAALRAELDRIDDGLQDLLNARAQIVAQVATAKPPGAPFLRPGREAQILRRLIARQRAGDGALPEGLLLRIVREYIAGLYDRQGGVRFLLHTQQNDRAAWDIVRDAFSSQAQLVSCSDPEEALTEAGRDNRTLALLSEPRGEETTAWWLHLARLPAGPKILARLPFWPQKGPVLWAVGLAPPEASGEDRTILALNYVPQSVSRGKLIETARMAGLMLEPQAAIEPSPQEGWLLTSVEGFLNSDDSRILSIAQRGSPIIATVWLGAYAKPLAMAEA